MTPRVPILVAIVSLGLGAAACGDPKQTWDRIRGAEEPVELPALLTTELPFQYPPALYVRQVPGDVTLRLFIDSLGLVVPESTQVAEPASHPGFDSAAVEGASRLVFRPARRGERRIGYTVLFPIKFRVPGAPASAGDTTRTKS
ncbi:MAG TPA: TonB family protein [Gemmatimonadaceae bacterium]|nr:TonB family protein [Gemmatimonadaceae bacterium]